MDFKPNKYNLLAGLIGLIVIIIGTKFGYFFSCYGDICGLELNWIPVIIAVFYLIGSLIAKK